MSDPSFYGPGEKEFIPWGDGEPSTFHDEQCTTFRSVGTWGDYPCNAHFWVVCFDVTGKNINLKLILNI